jgi:pSer/pThr/pTyr-binding forkhead associated (FHA) protein
MQEDIDTVSTTTNANLELFHVQSSTSFKLPENQKVIRIGKPNDLIVPDVNISHLPERDIISRQHAEIHVEKGNYYLVDVGSANGTYLNHELLEPKKRYLLKLSDTPLESLRERISLGKDDKISFIFQSQHSHSKTLVTSHPTRFQSEVVKKSPTQVDKTSKIVGLALMVASIVIVAANTQVGIFIRIPGILLCVAGAVFLFQRRFNRTWGWILIALGIAVILFTGNVFASVNFLAILVSAALFVAGYQLMMTGKVLKYSLRSLQGLIKK